MSVSLLIITHGSIGKALLNATMTTLGEIPLMTEIVEIKADTDPETMIPELREKCKNIDKGKGVLILTDIYGSTPSNIAKALCCNTIEVITGLNLPMLIRVMNYPQLELLELADKAYSGGSDGIINLKKHESK